MFLRKTPTALVTNCYLCILEWIARATTRIAQQSFYRLCEEGLAQACSPEDVADAVMSFIVFNRECDFACDSGRPLLI